VSDAELSLAERFCEQNGLDEIGRICAELRTLRAEYISLSNRVGKQRALIEALEHDPQIRYSKELDSMIAMSRNSNAKTVP
jgi:hypothetical protein